MSLISAERLHRWKCQYCGSKDKNIICCKLRKDGNRINGSSSKDEDDYYEGMKIVTCSQCGHTMLFGHSALAVVTIFNNMNSGLSLERSEEFVKESHMLNQT